MTGPTARQRAVVLAVADLTARRGYPPSYQEVAREISRSSTSSIAVHVRNLRRAGILRGVSQASRALALADDVVTSRDGKVARIRPVTQNTPGDFPAGGAYQPANDPTKGDVGMTHSVSLGAPTVDSPRGKQLAATMVQQHLLSHDLPFCCVWRVDSIGDRDNPVITGQLAGGFGDQKARKHIAAWAAFLGVVVSTEQIPQGRVKLTAEATYRGVPVEIWTSVAAPARRAS